jgi:hypothetical protein
MHVSKDSMWREIWKILQNFLGTKHDLYGYVGKTSCLINKRYHLLCRLLFKATYRIKFWTLLQKVENRKVVWNAFRTWRSPQWRYLLDKDGGLHIGYVKGVESHFALLFVELWACFCEDSYCDKERQKHHPDVEVGIQLFHYYLKKLS